MSGSGPLAAANSPLILGVFPYLNTKTVVSVYQPVREYLEEQLARPVKLYTAVDFQTFVKNTRNGDYDIAVTPPHFARLAQLESDYIPLLRYSSGRTSLLVVAADSPLRNVAELRGTILAMPDKLSLISLAGLYYIKKHGLRPDTDFTLLDKRSHYDAVVSVVQGNSSAALTSSVALSQMPRAVQDDVRIIASVDTPSDIMYIANPRLGPDEIRKCISVLVVKFAQASTQGRNFFRNSGYNGFQPVSDEELRSLDPYVREIKPYLDKVP